MSIYEYSATKQISHLYHWNSIKEKSSASSTQSSKCRLRNWMNWRSFTKNTKTRISSFWDFHRISSITKNR